MRLNLKATFQLALTLSLTSPSVVHAETILYIPVPPEYLGGFAAVPVEDRGVKAAANYAADTQSVRLVDIVAAKQQLAGGKTYVLCLYVKRKTVSSPSNLVMTKIFKPSGQAYQLKSWTRVSRCSFND